MAGKGSPAGEARRQAERTAREASPWIERYARIGFFLVRAALQTDPKEARGLGGALATLARRPFGPYLLGAAALGLVSHGVFIFVMARYRRIRPA